MTTKEMLNDVIDTIDDAATCAMRTGQDLCTAKYEAINALQYAIVALPEYIEGYAVREVLASRLEDVEDVARSASAVAYFLCRSNDILKHVADRFDDSLRDAK